MFKFVIKQVLFGLIEMNLSLKKSFYVIVIQSLPVCSAILKFETLLFPVKNTDKDDVTYGLRGQSSVKIGEKGVYFESNCSLIDC